MIHKTLNLLSIFAIMNSYFMMYVRHFLKNCFISKCEISCYVHFHSKMTFTVSFFHRHALQCMYDHRGLSDPLGSDLVFCLHRHFLNRPDIDHLSIWFANLMRLIVNKISKCLQAHRKNTTAMHFVCLT